MRPVLSRVLVGPQIALLLAMTIAPAGVLAADPTPDLSASPTATADPSPTTDPAPSADPAPTDAPSAPPDPAPSADPAPSDSPVPSDAAPTDSPSTAPDPSAAPGAAPSITSDKDDYAPGELVTLTGAGWQPGETVHIYVNDDWGSSWSRNVDVTADDAGAITDQFNLPSWFVAVYSVVATTDAGDVVRYSFTDSQPQNINLTNPAVTVGPGGTADYGTLTVTFNGSSSSCTVTLALDPTTPLPAGASAVFGTTTLTSTGTPQTTTFSITTTSATPAGSTTFRIRATGGSSCSGNGTATSGNFTLVVAKRVGTVTVGSQTGTLTFGAAGSATYTVTVNRQGTGGGPFTADLSVSTILPAGVTASFASPSLAFGATDTTKSTTLTLSTTAAAGAGTTPFTVLASNAAITGDTNSAGGSLVIGKASSTTTVTCPTNVTYTGSPLTPCTATATGAGSLNQALTVTYGNNTNAGTASASASYAGDANHASSSSSASFTIDKAGSTTTVTCPTNVTFTGSAIQPCTAAATGAGSLNTPLTVVYSNNVGAGTASASASYAGDTNHTSSSSSTTFTIDKAGVSVLLTCPASATFTGSAIQPCTALVTRVGASTVSATVTYGNNTNAGTASASASYAGDANHQSGSSSTTFDITRASSTTVVSCAAGPFTFTGDAIEPCTVSVTGAGGLSLTPAPHYTDNVHAGTATASYTFAGDANHDGSSDSETFAIGKAATTTTVSCPAHVTYDGSARTPCTAAVTGPGLDQSLTVTYGNNTNAGTATASASFGGTDDYEPSADDTTFTIDRAPSTTTVVCTAGPFVYTGSAIEPCSATVTGAGGLDTTADVTYSDNVDAGQATASAAYAGDANHLPSGDSTHFTIDQATITVDANPASKVYHQPDPAFTATLNGFVNGEDEDSAGVTGAPVCSRTGTDEDAGTYTDVISCTPGDLAAANYQFVTGDSATFTIGRAPSTVVVSCDAGPFVYQASAYEPCKANVTSADDLDDPLTVVYTANVNAGQGTATASYAGDQNHQPGSDTKHFTIDRAPVSVDASPSSKTYGDPDPVFTATLNGFVGGEDETSAGVTGAPVCSRSGDDEGAGTYADVISCTPGDLAAANYTFLGGDPATFTIDKAPSTTTVSCTAGPFTYTGLAQEPCSATVTGAGGLDEPVTVTYSDNVDAGQATASAAYAGDANHLPSGDSTHFTIDQATITVDANPASKVYHQPDPAFTATLNGFVNGEDEDSAGVTGAPVCSRTGTDEDAGTYTDVISCTPSDLAAANYQFVTGDSATFTINRASSSTTLTCPAHVTFTGSALEPCTAAVTGVGGLNTTVSVSYTANVNAGTAHASASYPGDTNHLPSGDAATFTIDKASSSTTITCPVSITYTGSALEPCTAKATGPALDLALTVSYGNNLGAGTASASASFAGDANHTGSSNSTTFTIDKASSTTSVSCPAHVTFTGSALAPCSATVTGAGGLNQSATVTYTNNIGAGTATANASFAGDANHDSSSNSKTFTIDKAATTTTVTCPASVIYTGSAVTPCTASVTGPGLSSSLTVGYANNTAPGLNSATASGSYPGDANRLPSSDSKTFSILFSTSSCLGAVGHAVLQPINTDNTSVFKQGSTVPVKFRVCDASGNSIGTVGVVTKFEQGTVINGVDTLVNEPVDSTTPDTAFRWSSTDQQWIFNLSTKTLTKGKTYVYVITLADASTIRFSFGLK